MALEKGTPRTRQSSLTLAAFLPWGSSQDTRRAESIPQPSAPRQETTTPLLSASLVPPHSLAADHGLEKPYRAMYFQAPFTFSHLLDATLSPSAPRFVQR